MSPFTILTIASLVAMTVSKRAEINSRNDVTDADTKRDIQETNADQDIPATDNNAGLPGEVFNVSTTGKPTKGVDPGGGYTASSVTTSREAELTSLLEMLFRGYIPSIRPTAPNATNDFQPTQVTLRMALEGIEEVSTSQQTMTARFLLVCAWEDVHFVWKPDQFSGTDRVMVRQDEVWLPDVAVGNSVHTGVILGFPELPVALRYGGQVTWSPTLITTTTCEFNILYYPFDSQLCTIRLQTSVSTRSDVMLAFDHDRLTFDGMAKNGQWELVDTEVKLNKDRRSSFNVYFLLKRRPSYYIFNSILPAVILSSLASLVFAIPADSGEKMGLSMTLLLAYSVNLTTVSNILPESSLQISFFVVYLISLMLLSSLATILSACVLKAHHTPDSNPVHPKAVITVKLLAATFVKSQTDTPSSSTPTTEQYVEKTRRRSENLIHPAEHGFNMGETGNMNCFRKCRDTNDGKSNEDNVNVQSDNTQKLNTATRTEDLTWQDVAVIWDRAMFRLFTVLILGVNIVLISIMASGELVCPVSVLPERDVESGQASGGVAERKLE